MSSQVNGFPGHKVVDFEQRSDEETEFDSDPVDRKKISCQGASRSGFCPIFHVTSGSPCTMTFPTPATSVTPADSVDPASPPRDPDRDVAGLSPGRLMWRRFRRDRTGVVAG